MNVSQFQSNEEVVFATYGIATFSKGMHWKFDSFVELAGNYSTSHYFDWGESSASHRPPTFHNPIVLSNKIRAINKETPILVRKLEELALKGYGIEQFNLEENESIKFPFKVKFKGNDIYDLKKEVITELAPKLNSITAVDIGISPSDTKVLFLDNFIVSDLLRTTQSTYESPWMVLLQETDNPSYWNQSGNLLESILLLSDHIVTLTWDTILRLCNFIVVQERPKVQWLTVLIVGELLAFHFEPFPFQSIATFLVVGISLSYYLLSVKPDVLNQHFTTSIENVRSGRWYTLVTSTFAHKDIDHLLRNVTAILVTMPILELLMDQYEAVCFLFLASVVSNLISLQFNGEPCIGASGVVYAMEGYLMNTYGIEVDWFPYLLEQTLFAIANNDAGIDNWAPIGGFAFGFIYKTYCHRVLT
ncbi:hypothetical protein HDV06_001715 [Boothiomyces sp. JEL0866]|nr:hypothetical protein HDV06_001715 [Boothiomyces sp. JEL0866]